MAGGVGGQLLAAGELRERILFLSAIRTDDRGFASDNWIPAFFVWAAARLQGGTNEQTQDRGALKLAVAFDVRYRKDITRDMRVVWRGMTFEITGPPQLVPMEGRLTVPCLEDESVLLAVDHLGLTLVDHITLAAA